jgi:hypothetical protein
MQVDRPTKDASCKLVGVAAKGDNDDDDNNDADDS